MTIHKYISRYATNAVVSLHNMSKSSNSVFYIMPHYICTKLSIPFLLSSYAASEMSTAAETIGIQHVK